MTRKTSSSQRAPRRSSGRDGRAGPVRYAVLGLGYISQVAMLPAFAHARANSRLVALVSDSPKKRRLLARRYRVPHTWDYDQFDECLESGNVDAVYIGLPNSMHADYAVRAARAGIHVLCEKPMAATEAQCKRMLEAAEDNEVRLMVGYRLHFDPANLEAVDLVRRRQRLGQPRIFTSTFTMQVTDPENIRLRRELGGGVLFDIGIYCINAARYLFGAEPIEVMATNASKESQRFREVDEMTSAVLRFPGDRLASFTVSFGAADVSTYRVVGTRGDLVVENAYEYAEPIEHVLTVGGRKRRRRFGKHDQFAAQLLYFSDCVLHGRAPEPSGREGLNDVRIIQALLKSAKERRPVGIDLTPDELPTKGQAVERPPVGKPSLVEVTPPGD